jgi:hypothetical protein
LPSDCLPDATGTLLNLLRTPGLLSEITCGPAGNIMTLDWQIAVALVCVAVALVLLSRRVRAFFRENASGKCGSSCGGCASPPKLVNLGEMKAFVSLESLERARNAGPDFTHSVKSDPNRAVVAQGDDSR